MATLSWLLFRLLLSLAIQSTIVISQFDPFSLDIPKATKCTTCDFNWPSKSYYGYEFEISDIGTTIDLDASQLVTFSAITINYKSYNTSDPTCDLLNNDPPFEESFEYEILIYHDNGLGSFVRQASKSGTINRENTRLNRISLIDGTTQTVVLTSGKWYVGLRLFWRLTIQTCTR